MTEIIDFDEPVKKRLWLQYKCPNCGIRFESHIIFYYCPICQYLSRTDIEHCNRKDIILIIESSRVICIGNNDMNYWTYGLNYRLLAELIFRLSQLFKKLEISFIGVSKFTKNQFLMEIFENEICSIKNLSHCCWLDFVYVFEILPFKNNVNLNCDSTIEALKKMNPDVINYMEEE